VFFLGLKVNFEILGYLHFHMFQGRKYPKYTYCIFKAIFSKIFFFFHALNQKCFFKGFVQIICMISYNILFLKI